MLQTGIPWEELPQTLGYGSGMTCWRRIRNWNTNGVWQKLHLAMLVRLREHDQIDWSRASIDIRFERRLDIHEALLKLAAAIICARFVDRWR